MARVLTTALQQMYNLSHFSFKSPTRNTTVALCYISPTTEMENFLWNTISVSSQQRNANQTITRYHFISTRMAIMKGQTICVGEDVEKLEPSYTSGEKGKEYRHFQKQSDSSSNVKIGVAIRSRNSTPRYIPKICENSCSHKKCGHKYSQQHDLQQSKSRRKKNQHLQRYNKWQMNGQIITGISIQWTFMGKWNEVWIHDITWINLENVLK